MKNVGLVLLAAGGSRRLGTSKQLLRDAAGHSLIRRAALAAVGSVCRPVVVVLGNAAEEITGELTDLPLFVTVNPDWQTGMASSLKAGLHALTTESVPDAVVVMVCDQPGVTSALLDSLAAAYEDSGHALVVCRYGEVLGVPALFGRPLFGALEALAGDEGARHLIRTYTGTSTQIAFEEGRVDIDTPDDLKVFTRPDADATVSSHPPCASDGEGDAGTAEN